MKKPNEVAQKEMLDYLGRWKHCSQADQCPPEEMKKCIEAEDAIRRLIEKVGEWQKRAEKITSYEHLRSVGQVGQSNELYEFVMDIRDFDFGKEET
jgi:hypothetical protein